jgi:hypothetical protein
MKNRLGPSPGRGYIGMTDYRPSSRPSVGFQSEISTNGGLNGALSVGKFNTFGIAGRNMLASAKGRKMRPMSGLKSYKEVDDLAIENQRLRNQLLALNQ